MWQRYRFWRRLYWLMFLAAPLWVLALGFLGTILFGSPIPAFAAFYIWLAAWAYVAFQVIDFPCPRCGRPFFHKTFYGRWFPKSCAHCGLPKWTDHVRPARKANGI